MNWEPARADHSIDRATASIRLVEPLDPNTFDELVLAGRKAAERRNLTNRVDRLEPLEIPQGEAINLELSKDTPARRRVFFRRLDAESVAVDEFSIGTQRIAWSTIRYRRWIDLFRLVENSFATLDQVYPISKHVKSVRLQYVDRFQSMPGGADHFEVLSKDSEFLTSVTSEKAFALHTHSGWFDLESSRIRKLTNVNIDVRDIAIPPPPDPRRKIGVLTMGQFEALDGVIDNPLERLNILHDYLKSVFASIITPEAADRVALND